MRRILASPKGRVVQIAPNPSSTRRLTAKRVIKQGGGGWGELWYLVDFGENIAGGIELTLLGLFSAPNTTNLTPNNLNSYNNTDIILKFSEVLYKDHLRVRDLRAGRRMKPSPLRRFANTALS